PLFKSQLWLLFRLCELRGNQRAAKDPKWAALLARVRVGKCTEEDLKELRDIVVKPNSSKQPAPKAVHLYATRRAVAESNRTYLEEHISRTNARLYESPALDVNVRTGAPLSPEVVWADPENTDGLEALFRVAVGVRVMLRHNIDVQDGLVNGACGFVEQVDADEETGEIENIWVAFEKNTGAKWRAEHETASVAISRRSATYLDMDGNKASRLQFPIVLAKATTIHKSQAKQAYVALSRCPSQALCSLEFFDESLRFNANAEWALTKLKAQQAGQDGSELWKQLFRPEESKDFYEARLAEMGAPDWSRLNGDQDGAEVERMWQRPTQVCQPRLRQQPPPNADPFLAMPFWGSALQKQKQTARPLPSCPSQAPQNRACCPATSQTSLPQPLRNCTTSSGKWSFDAEFTRLTTLWNSAWSAPENITHAAEAFLFENRELADNMQDHVAPAGDYSIEVMGMVLRTKAMQDYGRLRWQMADRRAMEISDMHGCVGAIVNLLGRHWVAVRSLEGNFLYLDSLEAHPRPLTSEQLAAILLSHPTYAVNLI
ncbi:ATP-dependent DNA helicase PIF1, partial [Symbiodinium microadriaticum]